MVIGDGVTEIPSGMVSLSTIRTLTVGKNVNSVDVNAFGLCRNFVEINNKSDFDFDSLDWESGATLKPLVIHSDENSRITETEDGYLFIYSDTTNYLFYYTGNEVDLVLPESFKGESYEIARYAFDSNDIIQTIVVSDGVTAIHETAFNWCYRLVSVTIGKNVEYMHEDAFNGCDEMFEIVDNSSRGVVNEIINGDNYSNIKYVKIIHSGESIIDIVDGKYVFITDDGVHYLHKVLGDGELVLPENYNGEMYEIAEDFEYNGTTYSLIIPDGVSAIGSNAFLYDEIYSVTIGKNVTRIDDSAFTDISIGVMPSPGSELIEVINYSKLNIIAGSTEFGGVAYYAKTVRQEGESSLTVVGDYIFITAQDENYLIKYIGNDASIELPSKFNGEGYVISAMAFANNINLKSIVIPEGVTGIGNGAFYYCKNLESVKISDSVKYIDDYAFEYCEALDSIIIPDSVTNMGDDVFFMCESLTIYCEATSKPDGWDSGWNNSWDATLPNGNIKINVYWGYTGE